MRHATWPPRLSQAQGKSSPTNFLFLLLVSCCVQLKLRNFGLDLLLLLRRIGRLLALPFLRRRRRWCVLSGGHGWGGRRRGAATGDRVGLGLSGRLTLVGYGGHRIMGPVAVLRCRRCPPASCYKRLALSTAVSMATLALSTSAGAHSWGSRRAAGVVRTVKDSSVTSRDGVGTPSVFRVYRRATRVYRCTLEFGDMYSLTGAPGGRRMIGQGQCLAAVCKWTVLEGASGSAITAQSH
jgi:hypothetical protein